MAVELVSVSHADEFGLPATDFTVGSIIDKIVTTLVFDIFWATEDISMTFTASTDEVERLDGGSFINDGFKVGDSITVEGSASNNGTYTIETVTDDVIAITGAFVNETAVTCSIFGDTAITSIDYFWNYIENDAPYSFKSLWDPNASLIFSADDLDASVVANTTMTQESNSKSVRLGSATITGVSITNHRQRFSITHTNYITPLFLSEWKTNLISGIPPNGTYNDRFSLRYAAKIDARFSTLDPTIPHTSTFEDELPARGNTSWFDEFLQGRTPEYTLNSITYVQPGIQTVDNLLFGSGITTKVTILIDSASSHFFKTSPRTQMVLNVLWLPNEESVYRDNDENFLTTFMWDRVFLDMNVGAINGDNFGTDAQIITAAKAVWVSNSQVLIEFTADLATALNTRLTDLSTDDRDYLIFVTPANRSKLCVGGVSAGLPCTVNADCVAGTCQTAVEYDRNAVICDVSEFTTDLDDDTQFIPIGNNLLYEYPNEATNELTDFKGTIRDGIYDRFQFKIKTSAATLTDMLIEVVAEKTGETDVLLDSFAIDLTPFPPDCQSPPVQNIDIDDTRGYTLPATDPRNRLSLQRLSVADTGNYRGYELDFGFKYRHEDWLTNPDHTDCFPDGTMDWSEYSGVNGYAVRMYITANMKDNTTENVTVFQHYTELEIDNPDTEPEDISGIIYTFDESGTNDLDGNVLADANTLVRAVFTGDFSTFPAGMDSHYGILGWDNSDIGGINYIRLIGTETGRENDSVWLGLPLDEDNALLTLVNATTIYVEAVIDYTKLDTTRLENYILSARLGYFSASGGDIRLLEDGSPRLLEDGTARLLE